MKRNLKLTLEESVIADARRLAAERGQSVSAMFSDLVRAMAGTSSWREEIPPLTTRLTGIISVPAGMTDRELITDALLERYGLSPSDERARKPS